MIPPSRCPHCLTDRTATQARNSRGSPHWDAACPRESYGRAQHRVPGVIPVNVLTLLLIDVNASHSTMLTVTGELLTVDISKGAE
jgi:hypothetical protein